MQIHVSTLAHRPVTETIETYTLLANPTVSDLKQAIAIAKHVSINTIYVFETSAVTIYQSPSYPIMGHRARYLRDNVALTPDVSLTYTVKHAADNTPAVERDNAGDLTIRMIQSIVSRFNTFSFAADNSMLASHLQTDCLTYVSQLWHADIYNVVFWGTISATVIADRAVNPYYHYDNGNIGNGRTLGLWYIFDTFPNTPMRTVLDINGKRVNITATDDSHGSLRQAIVNKLNTMGLAALAKQLKNIECNMSFNNDVSKSSNGVSWQPVSIKATFLDSDSSITRLSDRLLDSLTAQQLVVTGTTSVMPAQIREVWYNDILLRCLSYGFVSSNLNNSVDGVVIAITANIAIPDLVGTNILAWLPSTASVFQDGFYIRSDIFCRHYYLVPNDTVAQLKSLIEHDMNSDVTLYIGTTSNSHVDPLPTITMPTIIRLKDDSALAQYGSAVVSLKLNSGIFVAVKSALPVEKIHCRLTDITRYGPEYGVSFQLDELVIAGPDEKHDVADVISSQWGLEACDIAFTSVGNNSLALTTAHRLLNPNDNDVFKYRLLTPPPRIGKLYFMQGFGPTPQYTTIAATGDSYAELRQAIANSVSDMSLRDHVLNGPLVMNIALSLDPMNGCMSSCQSTKIIVRTTYNADDVNKPTLSQKLIAQLKTESRITDSLTGQPDTLLSNTQEQHGWIGDIITTYRDILSSDGNITTLYISWGFSDNPNTAAATPIRESVCTQVSTVFQKLSGWLYNKVLGRITQYI
jgi:hypothetical protein